MPHTRQINEWYEIVVMTAGSDRWHHSAMASIFRRDTGDQVGEDYHGKGTTLIRAEDSAFAAARAACPNRPPADWEPAA